LLSLFNNDDVYICKDRGPTGTGKVNRATGTTKVAGILELEPGITVGLRLDGQLKGSLILISLGSSLIEQIDRSMTLFS
jgi:hypothetical protein